MPAVPQRRGMAVGWLQSRLSKAPRHPAARHLRPASGRLLTKQRTRRGVIYTGRSFRYGDRREGTCLNSLDRHCSPAFPRRRIQPSTDRKSGFYDGHFIN